jgi:hypothetical protein
LGADNKASILSSAAVPFLILKKEVDRFLKGVMICEKSTINTEKINNIYNCSVTPKLDVYRTLKN